MSSGERLVAGWRKSSRTTDNTCVEVALRGEQVHVRNSRQPGGVVLAFRPRDWRVFLAGMRRGQFDGTASG